MAEPALANSFDDLLARLQAGKSDAATEVFERYAARLVALARSRMDSQLRQKVDPEDIAQSVFKSFFLRQDQGQFTLQDWGGLWGILLTITLRKCGRQMERFRANKRDIGREVAPQGSSHDSLTPWEAAGGEPTPEQAAILTETLETLMAALDARGRDILSLRLQGYTIPEISQQIGRTERTVHRTLADIKEDLAKING